MNESEITTDALRSIVEHVWSEVLHQPPHPCSNRANTFDLKVWIEITGAWKGSVSLRMSEDFARPATATLFQLVESEVVCDDIEDGMSELGNMLAGNLKSLVPGPASLSLPVVLRDAQSEQSDQRSRRMAEYRFESDGHELCLEVWEASRITENTGTAI